VDQEEKAVAEAAEALVVSGRPTEAAEVTAPMEEMVQTVRLGAPEASP
jgi:hypothetical protein